MSGLLGKLWGKTAMKRGRFGLGLAVAAAASLAAAGFVAAQNPRPTTGLADFPKEPYAGVTVMRDVVYGPDAKHRLDFFAVTAPRRAPRTTVIFVHGGAYRGGDKHAPGNFDYENIMLWARRAGMIGINMNYRLFEGAGFPAQEQDLGTVVQWAKANVGKYGGDPNRIFLFGHSSGAAVVANYATMPQFKREPAIRGLILLSSIMDNNYYDKPWAYYGATDKKTLEALSPQTNLAKSRIPVLMGHGDNDSVTVLAQMPAARAKLCAAGRCPDFAVTQGDHAGVAHAIGGWGGDPTFGNRALEFIGKTP